MSRVPCPGSAQPPVRRSVFSRLPIYAIGSFALLVCACSGEVELYDPNETPQDSIPTDIQKADITLTFQIATEDSTVSQALGWPEGSVPDAEVTLSRSGSSEELTGTTDADGRISFEKLLEGNYRASAVRILTEEERALLAEPDHDVNALGGGGSFDVAAPKTEETISLAAGRPRSLVISEWSFQDDKVPTGFYSLGGYLELYNNSDTIIYLDRKVIGAGLYNQFYDYNGEVCARAAYLHNDPDGIWILFLYQFPGTGRQYPLDPGHTAVVATDAINHKVIVETAADLSDAEFEFIGTADVDNPQAANLVSVGPRQCCALGHGLRYFGVANLAVVADPLPLDELTKELYADAVEVWRLPADKIVEVVTWRSTANYGTPPCPRMVHERFDRQEAMILDPQSVESGQRPIIFTTPDGRAVLQHTRTSARDFVPRQRTPGRIE